MPHVNGKLCFFPRGIGHNGDFVIADDTYREACLDRNPPQARCSVTSRGSRFYVGMDPDGWGVFDADGTWNRQHIHTPWNYPAEPQPQGTIDPQGCVFDRLGNLFGNDVGSGDPINMDPSQRGSLIVFFPGPRHEYDANGLLVRNIVPSNLLLNPLGMDVGSDGTLYYAELNLNSDTSTGCGRVSMVRFVNGIPQPPQVLGQNLSFPDGVTVVDSAQIGVDFMKLPVAVEPDPSTCNGSG